MRKFLTRLMLVCLIMTLAIGMTACGDDGDEKVPPPEDPKIIGIEASGTKTAFAYGESFTTGAIVVTKIYDDETRIAASKTEYTVDKSDYNAYIPGTYTIVVLLTGTAFQTQYDVNVAKKTEVEPDGGADYTKSLKLLAIGNSFSQDALAYAWSIAYDLGVTDLIIGNATIGGCSLQTHASNAVSNKAAYAFAVNRDGGWKTTSNATLLSALEAEPWDIVTMQQASAFSGVASTYNQDLYTIGNYIKDNVSNENVEIYWHMTWAYPKTGEFVGGEHGSFPTYNSDQLQMYRQITSAVQSMAMPTNLFAEVIPSGTTIQNLRGTDLKNKLHRDNCHLSNLGRFAAGMTYIKSITKLDVGKTTYRPDGNIVSDAAFSQIVGAVNDAVKTPYAVTS